MKWWLVLNAFIQRHSKEGIVFIFVARSRWFAGRKSKLTIIEQLLFLRRKQRYLSIYLFCSVHFHLFVTINIFININLFLFLFIFIYLLLICLYITTVWWWLKSYSWFHVSNTWTFRTLKNHLSYVSSMNTVMKNGKLSNLHKDRKFTITEKCFRKPKSSYVSQILKDPFWIF